MSKAMAMNLKLIELNKCPLFDSTSERIETISTDWPLLRPSFQKYTEEWKLFGLDTNLYTQLLEATFQYI